MATPITIKPAEGKWLTQANPKNEDERFFSDMIILGVNDKAENYIEWTTAQKEEWEKAHMPEDLLQPEA